jgi:S1-C subfamily serine protease
MIMPKSDRVALSKSSRNRPFLKAFAPYVLAVLISIATFMGGMPAHALPLMQLGKSLFPQGDSQSNFVTAAVDRAESAVVQVTVTQTIGDVPGAFRPFLGRSSVGASRPVMQGLGSGFVINPNGQILTNAHVVANADTVTVTFQDGRILEGKVLGKDPVTDVAVLQVQAKNLPAVTLANSDDVRQGQWAIAIGNPLGLQETVTVGVISGTERSSAAIGIADKRVGFIQTDAAINPGNSGGPLLNAAGEVIGINTAIIKGTQGLGFAIPINTARLVAQQLITTGKVAHPYIGIQMVALSPQVRDYVNQAPNSPFKVDEEEGILVVQVGKGTPAAKAGLKAGDVIQEVNDQSVSKVNAIQRLVDQVGLDGELAMKVKRGSRLVAVQVEPAQLPEAPVQ